MRSTNGEDSTPESGGASLASLELAPAVPDHVLLRRIGSGSYGELWLARSALGRFRAVKIVRREHFKDIIPYEREFNGLQRAEPISRDDEGLVDILHVGRNDDRGFFYYVMELADNTAGAAIHPDTYAPRTLASDLSARGHLSVKSCVALGLRLTDALGCVHRHGLIHRDVKPSNIVYVDGQPKLGDIGLVGITGSTAAGLGTAGYIPPEGSGTPQADIYSLGKVLYEAATGLDREEFPRLPRSSELKRDTDEFAELNAVWLKACAPDPVRRYADAFELRDDLARVQRGESVRARQRSHLHRRTLLITGLMIAVFSITAIWWHRRAPSPRSQPLVLGPFTNGQLNSNWLHDWDGNTLESLPRGNVSLAGIPFFIDNGLIQLAGGYTKHRFAFPQQVTGIPIGRKCLRLHFLHGTVWRANASTAVARYVLHYANGSERVVPVLYKTHVLNWWRTDTAPLTMAAEATVAWTGTNSATVHDDAKPNLYLFKLTWQNPDPATPISHLDFCAEGTDSCPFLIAVTAE